MKLKDSAKKELSNLQRLENLRWGNGVFCHRCNSRSYSYITSEMRYHCNTCYSSFSTTSGTVFHNTKIPIQKWIEAIRIVSESRTYISCRKLAPMIHVNKNTANRLLNQIRKHWHNPEDRRLMLAISKEDAK